MSARKKDIDYILDELVGGGGRWQWLTTLYIFPLSFVGGFPLFLSIWAAYTPKHRCFIEGCDSDDDSVVEGPDHVVFAIPKKLSSSNFLDESEGFDPCKQFSRLSSSGCQPESFNTSSSVTCDRFVYDRSQMTETLSTTLNMVCEDSYKKDLLGTVLMIGLMVGSLIGGRIGDRLGRKKAMFLSVVVVIPSVIIGGYVPNYYAYVAFRLITCTALPIMWINSTTYGLEYFSPKNRKAVTCITDIPFSGYLLAVVLYLVRDWTNLHLCVGLICCLALPVWFLIPESPRWLAGNNRKEEAEQIFLGIAKTNRRVLTLEQLKELKEILSAVDEETEAYLNPWDMFRRKYLAKTAIMLLSWSTINVGFYALTLSNTKLNGDIVLNYVYSVVADTPVFILLYFILDRFGRRYTLALSQLCLGVSCLVLAFISKSDHTGVLVAYMMGKTAAGIGFVVVYLATAEMFPTNLRTQALGICSMVSRIFGMSASFVPNLAEYWQPLPMLVLGVPTLVAAALALCLTETALKDLPQSMKDNSENRNEEEDAAKQGNNNLNYEDEEAKQSLR